MAAGKLSPRQKMIGMMYLVLTALLALNVSKEILEAFVTVNNGLENTKKSFDKDISSLYAKFDEKKSIDPNRVMENWNRAQQAKKLSTDMNLFIENLKKDIMKETEGFKNKEEDTIHLAYIKSKDNYDTPTNILCGESEDGKNGQAAVLKKKLNEYQQSMLALLSPEDQKALHLSIDTDDPKESGEFHTWEMKTFYHAPLAADVTLLSKIQDDVKGTEADVVDALLKETDSDIIPFDTVAARVIAQTNYVMLGEPYQADIFLAAFNKTLAPRIYIGQYDSITGKMIGTFDSVHVAGGLGKYSVNTTKEGIFTYEGVISMTTPKGAVRQFPFQSEYIVARPSLNVSADNMNVFYAGLDNPVTVSVPGVPNEKVHAHIDNGTLTPLGNGKYMAKGLTAGKAHISVSATLDNGEERNMGSTEFRVKQLPAPYVTVSGATPARTSASSICNSLGLVCAYDPNFNFNARANIVSYSIDVYIGGRFLYSKEGVRGYQLPKEAKDAVCGAKKGTKVSIYNITAVGADNHQIKAPDVLYTIQ
ncbi:MAG TPA: gliding motility protein GldM [Bacteroidia bacterium]|nr:gliding motility protein GldM [Bacteroidia bacterium]